MHRFGLQLREQLGRRLPGRSAHRQFAHQLSYGRHLGPAPDDARQAAVLIILRQEDATWLLPLAKRSSGSDIHASQICLPGGGIDPGESVREAALRESWEELGWAPEPGSIVGQLSPVYVYASNNFVTPVIAVTSSAPDWGINPAEVAELIEVPVAYLCSEQALGEAQLEGRVHNTRVRCFRWKSHTIWGATAMILGELRTVIQSLETR